MSNQHFCPTCGSASFLETENGAECQCGYEITNAEMNREELHFNPKYSSMSEWYGTIVRDDAAE